MSRFFHRSGASLTEEPNGTPAMLSFELEYNHRLYRYTSRPEGQSGCVSHMTWSLFGGYTVTASEVPSEVDFMVDMLLSSHGREADAYPMCGERYAARLYDWEGRTRLNIKHAHRGVRDTMRLVGTAVVRFLLAMLLACAAALLCTEHAGTWLEIVFSGMTVDRIRAAVWTVELGGAALLYVAIGRRAGFFGLCADAVVPVGVLVLIGIIKRYWWINLLLLPLSAAMYGLTRGLFRRSDKAGDRALRTSRVRSTVLTVLVAAILCANGTALAFEHRPLDPSEAVAPEESALMTRYTESCARLASDVWYTLSPNEKLAVLQAVSDYECRVILGCEPIRLQYAEMEREGLLGTYSDANRTATINATHLAEERTSDVLRTVFHEVRHSYQRRVVDAYTAVAPYMSAEQRELLLFAEARHFAENHSNYISAADGDYDAYAEQAIERDCREWADTRLVAYDQMLRPSRG